MTAYISTTFEKDALPSGQVRIIVKPRDDGTAPPLPSVTYFPTSPDTLTNFLVAEYIDDTQGERWVRVAVLDDFTTVVYRELDTFEDLSADFVSDGVEVGDTLRIVLSDPALWTSDDYPGTNPFEFFVTDVLSAQQITVSPPFPAFQSGISWEIVEQEITGSEGITRRTGVAGGSGPVEFRTRRFNTYYDDAATAEQFVASVKAGLNSLSNEASGVGIVDESYTGIPS